jgi:hypothetical protein
LFDGQPFFVQSGRIVFRRFVALDFFRTLLGIIVA